MDDLLAKLFAEYQRTLINCKNDRQRFIVLAAHKNWARVVRELCEESENAAKVRK